MSHDKSKPGANHGSKNGAGKMWDLSSIMGKFNVTEADVARAVKAVGNCLEEVERYLRKKCK